LSSEKLGNQAETASPSTAGLSIKNGKQQGKVLQYFLGVGI